MTTNGNLIKLAIAEDHKTFRQTLISFLSEKAQFCFIVEASNGKELIEKLSNNKPDILLLDIKMPGINGIEALKFISKEYPEVKVLILSAYCDEIFVAQCLRYGIYGYMTKFMEIDELVKAITEISKGEMYLSNLLRKQLCKNYIISHHKRSADLTPDFSFEEIKILNLLKEEKTTKEISGIMNLSKRSIELRRDKMREKANAQTLGGLLLYAMKRGIIE
ncbi:MAG TPA: response regulator transcription factor [Puia sp.]|jgi:DNA-binding NarL/FixJ family response regulator|nr:response regulator transcription factor [Puia sp.]